MAHAALAAEQVTRALVGRTVAHVERDLILETLKHCLGNRTHAANILGISIRTLRNKLNEYASDGLPIRRPWRGTRSEAGGQAHLTPGGGREPEFKTPPGLLQLSITDIRPLRAEIWT